MQKNIRQAVIHHLWTDYRAKSSDVLQIERALAAKNSAPIVLDHFAVIDLPGPQSGIPVLQKLFAAIGYETRGQDYLPDKQNTFLWMAEEDSENTPAVDALPQVVVADFRLDALPDHVRVIIEKYSAQTKPAPDAATMTIESLCAYFTAGRDWPLPTVQEFQTVHAFNELLAWVLVFGRKPNHFTLSVHLLSGFNNLNEFNHFIEHDVKIPLNHDGGLIKGNEHSGIAQSSSKGKTAHIQLADGTVELPTDFIEFVWRYPLNPTPTLWQDYFTGFVAKHADYVIESLYTEPNLSLI